MPRTFKVEELLNRDELDELEAFARKPATTVTQCHQWMLERGFTLHRSAVGTWKAHFDAIAMQERFSQSGELARAIKGAVDKGSFDDVAEAAVMQLTQVVFESATQLQVGGEIDPLDVQRMTKSLNNLIGGKAGLTKLLAVKFEKEMTKRTDGGKATLTAADIDAARKAIFGDS